MGCDSSLSTEEIENNRETIQNDLKDENHIKTGKKQENIKEKKENKKEVRKDNKKENKNEIKKNEKNKNSLNLKNNKKKSDKETFKINTEDNKDALSNVLTEGLTTNDGQRLNINKQHCNGVTIMQGIEECFSEDLNEDEVYELVEEALGENIIDDKNFQYPGSITSKQAKAIAKILYEKINKKDGDEDDKNEEIDIKNYPQLKGVNVKIGVTQLTKDVIKDFMFGGQKVDKCQIDLAYANFTKDNDDIKALSIQILP